MIGFLEFDWLRAELWPVALAVPLLLGLALVAELGRARRRRRLADAPLLPAVAGEASPRRTKLRLALELAAAALVVVALFGPVRGFTERPALRRGLDLAVCVDTSRSMLARDLSPDRLGRARREVRGLLDRLAGDRVALLAFSGDAREVAPLTRDTRTLSALLDLFDPAENRVGGTDLGAALERALDLFDGRTGAHEAIVVLTDGEDLSGSGLAVARRAADAGIRIYVVGIGTEGGGKIPIETADGRSSFLRGPDGEEVVTRLDRASLAAIAETTDGAFLTTSDSATPLEELYDKRIGRLDRRELESGMERIPHDRYQWALVPAVALWLLAAALGERRTGRRRRPRPVGGGTLALVLLAGLAPAVRAEEAAVESAVDPRHPLVAALEDAIGACEQDDAMGAIRLLDAALGEDVELPSFAGDVDGVAAEGSDEEPGEAVGDDELTDEAAGPTWEPQERAYLRHARGVANGRAGFPSLAEADFEAAAAGFGPGPERLAALTSRFVLRLERAEARRAELMAPPDPSAPPEPPDDDAEDPLAELRRLYGAAREAGLERLALDWRDVDVRANLELITKRLRELDRIEEQREEQEQEQENQDEQDQEGEQDEQDEQDQQDQQDQQDEQDQQDQQDPQDPQDPQDESEPQELPEQPEPQPAEPDEGEEPQEPEQAPEPVEVPELSKEELQRLMERLAELEEAQEAMRRRLQGTGSTPVERDW